ncbi:MAG: hypothetical protein JSV33_14745 [bacterium]|nr:MAG: hypothetical protein JSV33_14745 [bacterium]
MKRNGTTYRYLLLVLLMYGFLITVLNLNYNSIYMDEAIPILIGQQLLAGEPCPGCPYMTGSVFIQPIFMAFGDSMGGLNGARIMNAFFGLALAIVAFLTARLLFDEKIGFIAATIIIFSGQTLYLMKLATYDMIAAFFLGTAFLMLVVSTRAGSQLWRDLALLEGAVILFIASVTKYLLPVYIPFFLAYAVFKHGVRRTLILYIAPVAVLLLLYYLFAPFAPRAEIVGQVQSARSMTQLPLSTLLDWSLRWVSLAYLLAIFGIFHEKWGIPAILSIILSTPIIIVHLMTRSEQSVNKNMIYALVFLAPAAALGVDHIANLFSMRNASRTARTFFTVAVLVVFWAYGFNNLRWLERQYPDSSQVIDFFDENGFDGMRVALNGWDGVVLIYTFGDKYPHARYMHITDIADSGNSGPAFKEEVDFIICEEFYGDQFPCEEYEACIKNEYTLIEDFTITHSWGVTSARIFGRI